MKNAGKVSLLLVLALLLSLGLAASGGAQPMGMGMGMGHGAGHMMNLTPEQAGKLFDLKEKFRTDTASLRKSMMLKHLEMRDLWKAQNPDEKAIIAKGKEINGLREQLMEKMVPFRLEARKIDPNFGMGWGHGRGMGMGMGMGEGCGMGPGGGMCMLGGPGNVPPPPAAPPAK